MNRQLAIEVPSLQSCGLAAIIIFCLTSGAVADEVRIAPIENRSTAFAGEEIKLGIRVIGDKTPKGTLRWSHSASQRTISAGEVEVKAAGDVSATAELRLRPVELRDGVIFQTVLTMDFLPMGRQQLVASVQRSVWLFPRNPLAGHSEWCKALDIELFDPVGQTSKRFDELKLPYRSVRNIAALRDPKQNGVLIVGEGVSLQRSRSLADTVIQAAAAGRRVILLAPVDGSLPFPGTEDDGLQDAARPEEVRFAGHNVITEFDKRLDVKSWQGTGNTIPCSSFQIESHRGRVVATVTDKAKSWPWLEVHFPDNGGELKVCGFRLIQHWDNGPTPRYLLIRMLESVSEPGI